MDPVINWYAIQTLRKALRALLDNKQVETAVGTSMMLDLERDYALTHNAAKAAKKAAEDHLEKRGD